MRSFGSLRSLRMSGALVAALVALAAARAQDEVTQTVACPLDGHRFATRLVVSANEGGGRDSDGCRWAVDRSGRLEVLELREIVACPRCGAALYRAHLAAAAKLHRRADEAAIASALAAAGPLDARPDTAVAHAVATYRALGLDALGVREDPDAFEGKLWVRAAWAARMRLVRDEERGQPLPLVFAPRTAQDAVWRLENLDTLSNPDPDAPTEAPVEDALGNIEQARSVLDPLDGPGEPSQHLAFERVRGALDLVEQTLLVLRAKYETDKQANASRRAVRQQALAVARAAHRAGEGARRNYWLFVALKGAPEPDISEEASRMRTWVQQEDAHLARAAAALLRGAERAQDGARRTALLALAAEVTRRRISDPETDRELVEQVRELARRAAEGTGPAVAHAEFLRARVGK